MCDILWSVPQLFHVVFGNFPHGPASICCHACIQLLGMDARVQTISEEIIDSQGWGCCF